MKQQQSSALWMLSATDLRKDAIFFIPLGIFFGFAQLLGYRYINQSNFGTELFQEHVAFNSMVVITILLWLMKGIAEWWAYKYKKEILQAQITHITKRLIALASPAASVTAGFSLAIIVSGDYYAAFWSSLFALYCTSIAEIAANPLNPKKGGSKVYPFGIWFVSALPFIATWMS